VKLLKKKENKMPEEVNKISEREEELRMFEDLYNDKEFRQLINETGARI